jgi:hypothetical protein
MPAIRSGERGSAEFRGAVEPVPEPASVRLGRVQPTRHAKTASHTESPVATADLKV